MFFVRADILLPYHNIPTPRLLRLFPAAPMRTPLFNIMAPPLLQIFLVFIIKIALIFVCGVHVPELP